MTRAENFVSKSLVQTDAMLLPAIITAESHVDVAQVERVTDLGQA
jgi:hypothetical protein